MNYEELVKALRCKRDDCDGCDIAFFDKDEGWMCRYAAKDDDAAAAIEALNNLVSLNTERCEGLRKQLREAQEQYEKHLNELEQQLPKQGEWIKHPEVKNIYGGVYIECPLCGEKYVVQYVSDEKFCRNCGADLRAKMEVQG